MEVTEECIYPMRLVAAVYGIPATTVRHYFDHGALGDGVYIANGRRERGGLFLGPCAIAALGTLANMMRKRATLGSCRRVCNYLAQLSYAELEALAAENKLIVSLEDVWGDTEGGPVQILDAGEPLETVAGLMPVIISPERTIAPLKAVLERLNQFTNEEPIDGHEGT